VVVTSTAGTETTYNLVVRKDVGGMIEEIKELIGKVDGLDIRQVGTKVLLEGDIFTSRDYERIKKVAAAYPSVVFDQTHFDQSAIYKYIAEAIRREIGYDGVTVKMNDDTVYLEGEVISEAEKARAELVASGKKFPVKNFLTVAEVSIETDVVFLDVSSEGSKEFGQNLLSNLGVSSQGQASGSGIGKPSFGWGVGANVNFKLNAALGNAKNLNKVQQFVTAKNGAEGYIQAGGEQGVAVTGNVGGSLEKVQYGVILKVKPTLQGRDRVVSDITLELSVPTAQGPGSYTLAKSQTKTTVSCKIGESVVLSGMFQDITASSKNKTPLLGDVPLLKLFFAQSSSRNTRKEVVMIMTPRILTAGKSTAEQQSEEARRVLQTNGVKQ
jgi:Flp pilus assembly secretin CpaC